MSRDDLYDMIGLFVGVWVIWGLSVNMKRRGNGLGGLGCLVRVCASLLNEG